MRILPFLLLATACTSSMSDPLVARVDAHSIHASDVDRFLANELRELRRREADLRRDAVEQLVNERLLELAAAERGVPPQAYVVETVESQVPSPAESDIASFFQRHRGQLPPGARLEDYRQQIVTFLNRDAYVDGLRALYASLRSDADVHIVPVPEIVERVEVEAVGPAQGPVDAPVTLIVFSDFQCPFCAKAANVVTQLRAAYPERLRVVFRQLPLDSHPRADAAAQASLCAADQEQFWPFHDALFAEQGAMADADFVAHAERLGLDVPVFRDCLQADPHRAAILRDKKAAADVSISGTPAFILNGVMLRGLLPIEDFRARIDAL